jgi:pyruvate/2-oxoglutarate dehydrogenase complex dihydrolipoamide dehydrogenase (E3) component
VRLLVLGGGPAGATAAAQARELGADVTLLEAEQVDVVPSGSFTNPEYGSVGLTEDQAAGHHDIAVDIAWYDGPDGARSSSAPARRGRRARSWPSGRAGRRRA